MNVLKQTYQEIKTTISIFPGIPNLVPSILAAVVCRCHTILVQHRCCISIHGNRFTNLLPIINQVTEK